jgi:predicted extracellular nuclease
MIFRRTAISLATHAFTALAAFSALAATAHAADTPIYAIQGAGNTSPLAGQTVTTVGVVTRVNNNSFFLQDLVGDANPATSDGILVFTSSAPTVAAGNLVRLTGRVTEFNTGAAANADTAAHTVTELTTISNLSVIGTGQSISPVVLTLPLPVGEDFERYEGMLVTINGPLTASQNYFQGRYGQVTLSAQGRLETPTNRVRPGPDALALNAANARRSFILDDGTSLQNPNPMPYTGADNTLRAGDTVGAVTGVLDYGLATASNADYGSYKLQPTVAPVFTRQNARTEAPEAVGGNIRLASFNVLNYFTTFTNGATASGQTGQGCTLGGTTTSASNCRGASNLAEFNRQRAKIVEALAAINADAVGLMEIQNNGNTAVQNLVDALNARVGAGTYAAVPEPTTAGGTGTDAIKVAMVYKPARLGLAGAASADTNTIHNRPPLAQTFAAANGEKFTVVVNHFKSKGCDGATGTELDQGDLQGCWNPQRVQQAQALKNFVGNLQATSGSQDVLLLGDLNAYAKEDPIALLTNAGYVDQIGRFNSFGYSYVFNGAAGRLDHAITTASLSPKVVRAVEWHINADEPAVLDYNLEFKQPACANCTPDLYSASAYRSSDHDPVVLGLSLFKTINGTAGRDTLAGTPGDDYLIGGAGADTLSGGAGSNVFAFTNLRDAGDTVTDFVPGKDLIDLRPLLTSLGVAAGAPGTESLVRVLANGQNAVLQFNTSGAWRSLATLQSVVPADFSISRDVVLR